jgi:hypothetical protein
MERERDGTVVIKTERERRRNPYLSNASGGSSNNYRAKFVSITGYMQNQFLMTRALKTASVAGAGLRGNSALGQSHRVHTCFDHGRGCRFLWENLEEREKNPSLAETQKYEAGWLKKKKEDEESKKLFFWEGIA